MRGLAGRSESPGLKNAENAAGRQFAGKRPDRPNAADRYQGTSKKRFSAAFRIRAKSDW